MRPKRKASIASRLVVLPFAEPPGDLSWICCVHCGEALDLQQPNAQVPDRLLGICEGCSLWFLIELVTERSEVMMVQLPEGRSLREASS